MKEFGGPRQMSLPCLWVKKDPVMYSNVLFQFNFQKEKVLQKCWFQNFDVF